MHCRCCRAINEFVVESEGVPIPGDANAPVPEDRERILFRRASLAHVPSLLRKVRRQLVYDVGDGFLIEPHDDVAVHINLKGSVITLDCPDARLPVAVAWAVHAGLGAATLTHGGLPLHGAGLEIAGRAIGLMAGSGAGKSTLSWFLLQQSGGDARFGSDDLIPVRITSAGETIAFPAVSLFPKLSRQAVDRHDLNVADLLVADYGTGEEEYYVPLPPSKRVLTPQPLSALFVLHPAFASTCGRGGECACEGNCACAEFAPGEVVPRRLSVDDAATLLLANLHAVWLIGKWMDTRRLKALCRTVAEQVPMYELSYVRSFGVLSVLEQTLRRVVRELGTVVPP